jgi:hypothetical protein
MNEEIVKQRKIYFSMIDEIVNLTGYQKQEVHEICKKEILRLHTINDKPIQTTKDIKLESIWKSYTQDCKDYWYEKLDIVL